MKNAIITLSLMTFTMLNVNSLAAKESSFVAKSTRAHDVTLLNHGLGSLEQRLQMIERAQSSIDVEYFIYRTDKSAKIFTQALARKAREGVKVRILLDYFMVKSDFSPFYAHELEKSGAIIKYFNTTGTLNAFSGQYRNHRKVLIVDGKEAITGGRNIGDEYFDLSSEYNFLDREIYIQGELVEKIEESFNITFDAPLSEHVARGSRPKITDSRYNREKGPQDEALFEADIRRWNNKISDAENFINSDMELELFTEIRKKGNEELDREYRGVCNQISFHSEYPDLGKENRKTNRILKYDFFERIKKAKKSVMLDSPYFIVDNELGKTLENALKRDVKIKLLTNSLNSTDAIYVYTVFDTIIPKWFNKGLDSYIFKGMLPDSYEVLKDQVGEARFGVHAKTFIFDGKDVVIGTYNIDPRSANYNSEMTVTCENNPELGAAVQSDINVRLKESIRLDSREAIKKAEFYQISFAKKMLYYLLKGPSYLFKYLL